MDFVQIKEREAGTAKKPVLEVYPDFKITRSKDLMIRGKSFYGIWDEDQQLWVTDEYAVANLVDKKIREYETTTTGFMERHNKLMNNFSSNAWLQFRNYMAHLSDHFHQLDENVTFRNTEVTKEDYVSRRLPYDLAPGDISAWDELVGTLYDSENRAKIEWAIGAIVSGDSKAIQKFLVFYGAMGTGKSTIMNIIQMLFDGYFTAFVAKELTGANNSFALEPFKANPLVAIEHDGDLSKIQDNTKLNSLVSHEWMQINEKNKPIYKAKFNAMLMIGSNNPVKITDAKSGLIRRLIDIHPTGNLLSARKYQALMGQIHFELGAIAHHCLEVYRSMGKDYYSGYRPIDMMLQTDVFYNFIVENYDLFKGQDGVTLNQAYEMYKQYAKDSGLEFVLPKHKLRGELQNYFENYEERPTLPSGERVRSWFSGFNADRFKAPTGKKEEQHMFALVMEEEESLFDKIFADRPAQYSNAHGNPKLYWDDSQRTRTVNGKVEDFIPEPNQIVSTILSDLDTSKEHYVKVPENHIVIDFDLQDKDGKKSAERNLEAASQWPSTYAEFSKSGDGIHLHYNYTGDPAELAAYYDDHIEVKVYTGNSSLRRRLSRCNNVPIADISSGLPMKEKKVINEKRVEDERHLRNSIKMALRKEVHQSTKPNVDFIHHVLQEAYKSGMTYNVTDMRQAVLVFAMGSSNQKLECMKLVQTMQFASEDAIEEAQVGQEDPNTPPVELKKDNATLNADREVIYDVEVFPNLCIVSWKYAGAPRDSIVTMINPTAREIEKLLSMKLVGFNVRHYDNHILHGIYLGYDNAQLYALSKRIIDGATDAKFGEAYNHSYADIYDFATKKQSLKKWEIELGIHHMELGLPWDEPVPKHLWKKVALYCENDVEATDVTFKHLEGDYIARQILAELSGLSVNASTNQHTARIIFGDQRDTAEHLQYTDLSEMFPGYSYQYNPETKTMESTYMGEVTGEGGLVRARPGIYENVFVFDIQSMHPTSIEQLNLFGKYTENFSIIKDARVAIKKGDYDTVRQMMGGKLARYMNKPELADMLSDALKIAINAVYGQSSARYVNPFRDVKNVDNIVAKRGALFMMNLRAEVEKRGFIVIHIKTDSIKIADATPEIIEFIYEYAKQYGYIFEHEATYSKFCLVNDAVYIAKVGWAAKEKKIGKWEAVGKQFQHPYVFKYLFSKEEILPSDMFETKEVKTAMYLDYTGINDLPGDVPMAFVDLYDPKIHGEVHNYEKMIFIGKVGSFAPMQPGTGGGYLLRKGNDGKFAAVTGTKDWQWLEAEMVEQLGLESCIETAYFEGLINDAIEKIREQGDYERFMAG